MITSERKIGRVDTEDWQLPAVDASVSVAAGEAGTFEKRKKYPGRIVPGRGSV